MIELAGDVIKIKRRKQQSVYKERNISTNLFFFF